MNECFIYTYVCAPPMCLVHGEVGRDVRSSGIGPMNVYKPPIEGWKSNLDPLARTRSFKCLAISPAARVY